MNAKEMAEICRAPKHKNSKKGVEVEMSTAESPFIFDPSNRYALPLPIDILAWEDLGSFISRAAERMHYERPRWILRPRGLPPIGESNSVSILRLRATRDFRTLERILNHSIADLYTMTQHRFATVLQEPKTATAHKTAANEIDFPLLDQFTTKQICRSSASVSVCPSCLAETPAYGRLYWSLRPIVICPLHATHLIDRCPGCGASIPILRKKLQDCPQCGASYTQGAHKALNLGEDSLIMRAQQRLFAALGVRMIVSSGQAESEMIEAETNESHLSDKRGRLHNQGELESGEASALDLLAPWQYLRLYRVFRRILDPYFPENQMYPLSQSHRDAVVRDFKPGRYLRVMRVTEEAAILATVEWTFLQWPNHFHEFLEMLTSERERRGQTAFKPSTSGLTRHYGELHHRWLYDPVLAYPAFTFLRNEFASHVAMRYRGGHVYSSMRAFRESGGAMLDERPLIPQRQAAAMLHTNAKTVKRWTLDGTLSAFRTSPGKIKPRGILFERSQIEELQKERDKKRKDFVSLSYAAKALGLGKSGQTLLGLADVGILQPVCGPTVDESPKYFYLREDVDRCVQTLLTCAAQWNPDRRGSDAVTPLHSAYRAVTGQINIATCLRLALAGEFPIFDTGDQLPVLRRLVMRTEDVKRFRDHIESSRKIDGIWMTAAEVAVFFNVNRKIVKQWRAHGIIKPERPERHVEPLLSNRLLYLRADIERVSQDYVTTAQAMAILHVSRCVLRSWIQRGSLTPIVGHSTGGATLFRRVELEALAEGPDSSQYVTYAEAAVFLGKSRDFVASQISQGRLHPIVTHATRRHPEHRVLQREEVEALLRGKVQIARSSNVEVSAPDSQQTWLSVNAASARLEVDPKTLRSWITAGEVAAQRVPRGLGGNRLVWVLSAVEVERLREERVCQDVNGKSRTGISGFLSPQAAAAQIGMTSSTLIRWARNGDIPCKQVPYVGGRTKYWFDPSDVVRAATKVDALRRTRAQGISLYSARVTLGEDEYIFFRRWIDNGCIQPLNPNAPPKSYRFATEDVNRIAAMKETLVTHGEVAKILHRDTVTVHRLVAEGHVTPALTYLTGGKQRHLYQREQVELFAREQAEMKSARQKAGSKAL